MLKAQVRDLGLQRCGLRQARLQRAPTSPPVPGPDVRGIGQGDREQRCPGYAGAGEEPPGRAVCRRSRKGGVWGRLP
jgi:hypothetical protein